VINELYQLSKAMENAGVQATNWHRKYKPIPNVKPNAPCVRICMSNGKVTELSFVDKELGSELRKYGTNQGSYPCMNMVALYRVTDEKVKKEISDISQGNWETDSLEKIKSWCTENNWNSKFLNKYKISMKNTTEELVSLMGAVSFEPLTILMDETSIFSSDPMLLHKELENAVFRMLERKENIELAFTVLFYMGNPQKKAENDSGSLSVALESEKLIDMGIPAVSVRFTEEFNAALLHAESIEKEAAVGDQVDAFGVSFLPLEEPMPEVKLAGGFDVKLRTMFKEQKCQTRYGNIENASYPISPLMRKNLQTALNWMGNSDHEDITWINTDRNEILFAYPSQLPKVPISFTRPIRRPRNEEGSFVEQSKKFISEFKKARQPGTDPNSEYIQIFILRKVDKARTKVIYTRQTDPDEIEVCSEAWTIGCGDNLPLFPFGSVSVPFPIDAADILNYIWKQDGTLASDNFKPIPRYHGMELFLERDMPVQRDLHILVQSAEQLGAYLGKLNVDNVYAPIWWKVKGMLALIGLLLYRAGIRKEQYMENFPYLYGQLLKISDELHALYCNAVRDGSLPSQLAGGSLFRAAADAPVRTLNLLGQRMAPYIIWAKSYRTKKIMTTNEESWRAGWLLNLYEKIATQLESAWTSSTRFNDEEKAQLFIGYLAAFPKKEQPDEKTVSQNLKEEKKDE
jgi:hypothetical protein